MMSMQGPRSLSNAFTSMTLREKDRKTALIFMGIIESHVKHDVYMLSKFHKILFHWGEGKCKMLIKHCLFREDEKLKLILMNYSQNT